MDSYKCLSTQEYSNQEYRLVPIRMEDRHAIMKWRNEQMYHLRQNEPLTTEKQDNYFVSVVTKLFSEEKPEQLLFSFLKDDVCIGYGGLVHINWQDKNAEISFIMKTELEQSSFQKLWGVYLDLIEQIGFKELNLHKLYVYAFDLRPHLYKAIEAKRYFNDARLKDHCLFNGEYVDVVIHSKINGQA
ncbi:GNAT family N-acetyltransferase [Nonlabens xiamenensis]|uniref:GNAT family N-acetyltransferase n=1 Tax=Nonlabens xiamenensis TaxID=2341043 RepID=UPI000F60BC2D|nr:GNAT family N-acetyltransferase [Nonlabens xiamenensis]